MPAGDRRAGKGQIMLLEIVSRQGWPGRLRFIAAAMLAPSDRDLRFLPFRLPYDWPYYLIRPIRQLLQLLEK
jgi:hypothetical protein